MNFEPQWVEVETIGENTKHKYFGKFLMKPFLTLKERAAVAKLYQKYALGMPPSEPDTVVDARWFLNTLAFLKFVIVEVDSAGAEWWSGEEPGMNLYDDGPIFYLFNKYAEMKKSLLPEETEESV